MEYLAKNPCPVSTVNRVLWWFCVGATAFLSLFSIKVVLGAAALMSATGIILALCSAFTEKPSAILTDVFPWLAFPLVALFVWGTVIVLVSLFP